LDLLDLRFKVLHDKVDGQWNYDSIIWHTYTHLRKFNASFFNLI
jgi:hypothetical protein